MDHRESAFNSKLKESLEAEAEAITGRKNALYWERVENILRSGTPDVYIAFDVMGVKLIESKYAMKYPAREATRVFGNEGCNNDQVNTLRKMWRACPGSCYIAAGVDKDLFIVPGGLSPDFNDMNKEQLMVYAVPWGKVLERLNEPAGPIHRILGSE